MEDRDDLEKILLDGLPPDEREQTLETIATATAERLARLRETVQRESEDSDQAGDVDEDGEEIQAAGRQD